MYDLLIVMTITSKTALTIGVMMRFLDISIFGTDRVIKAKSIPYIQQQVLQWC